MEFVKNSFCVCKAYEKATSEIKFPQYYFKKAESRKDIHASFAAPCIPQGVKFILVYSFCDFKLLFMDKV